MDMGVIFEGPSPGVQDAEESREICADVVFIPSELFHSFRGGLEEGRVS
jgi:hypothetical protein